MVVKHYSWMQYFFNPQIALKISEYKITPYPVTETVKQNLHLYPMFHSEPYQVSSPNHKASEEGQQVLMVHAPGEMRFRASAGKHTFSAQFGILKGAYSADNKYPTDGVEFSALLHKKNGHALILFKRFLNPQVVEADRGLQNTTVSFEIEKDAELVLRTHPGAANNTQCDWSFWNAVQINRPR
ncbi:glycosyl transferase family protein [Candidatus Thiomargarita nelsonii]|uniref:Glycosyl transferase family protein n=1 Tax=Candidatus Thiomargarita nelsonii TaxID=1003181 RepID=A0A176S2W8_9GAMM|nr:glycosyl transferase family protein [Candidatus Thiomargarita nelsonii]